MNCGSHFCLLSVPASTSWPEFEIEIDYEGTFDSDSDDENNSKSLVMQRHGKPDAMMQSWMDQFEVLGPFSFLHSLWNNLCWTSAYASIIAFIYCYLGRLMLTTNAGHLFKSGSQEHHIKC